MKKTCTDCKFEPDWKEAFYHHPFTFDSGLCKKSGAEFFKCNVGIVYIEIEKDMSTFEDCNLWEPK